jgi:hypothetical protein
MMNEQEIKEQLNSISPEDRAKIWEDMVRREVTDYLDIFLPEAITGNIGVIYDRPVLEVSPRTGEKIIATDKAKGVKIIIEFTFADTVQFFDKEPE